MGSNVVSVGRLVVRLLLEWILLAIIGVLIYVLYINIVFYIIPISWKSVLLTYDSVVRSIIIVTIGVVLVWDTGRRISDYISKYDSVKGTVLKFVLDTILIVAILIALAVTFERFGLSVAAFSGTAVGIIVGLAAQQTLSNVIAGIVIIMTGRYKPGDRVTIVNWRYGIIRVMYPHEGLPNGFTGIIRNITLMFTEVVSDAGWEYTIPNYVMLDALIIHRNLAPFKRIRARIDMPSSIDPWIFEERIKESLKDGRIKSIKIKVGETWQSTNLYQAIIEVLADGKADGEEIKDLVLREAVRIRNELSKQQ
ncbi:MscS Mechanosensitive ion channel [Vulcanisaeta moutnovskia 768-28]|uniref:MscS Mechanosensitive ion channel n=1 Tax=Vulcanisaeta moutnovskia (strain 768-28) TaxID=985053 RepID=F0QXC5_VULM7|nr:mechanosensitive ion channel family protein [Vulcanisaeta moutnovskia]ADY01164.1 MscS Mechanosensitive ion channel [Vulcanisaeta moutnovskia 768-28]